MDIGRPPGHVSREETTRSQKFCEQLDKMWIIWLVVVAAISILEVRAYHHGGTDTNCWRGPGYKELMSSCDEIATVEFLNLQSEDLPLHVNEPFSLTAVIHPHSELRKKNGYLVPHSNFHFCKAELGWCTPDVKEQPGLVTQSPSLESDSIFLNVTNLIVESPGDWSVVAHFSIINDEGEWDVAAGFKRRFRKRRVRMEVGNWAIVTLYILASIGLCFALSTAILIFHARKHWVFRASSPYLSLYVTGGCIMGFVCVYILPPPSAISEGSVSWSCNARIWLLSLAFDLVLVPFALKTWRVSILFGRTASFRRVKITDNVLIRLGLVLIIVDIIFCSVWTGAFPLYPAEIPSLANPELAFMIQCTGQHQLTFEVISIIAHGLPLIWLAVLGRKVRTSFKKRGHNSLSEEENVTLVTTSTSEKKMNQFNESESLSLTIASLACVSLFAVALQYTVTDSPTAQMLMVAGGVIWSGFFTLIVLFVPRIVDFMKLEEDGVTKRTSNPAATVFARRFPSGESSGKKLINNTEIIPVSNVPVSQHPTKTLTDDLALL